MKRRGRSGGRTGGALLLLVALLSACNEMRRPDHGGPSTDPPTPAGSVAAATEAPIEPTPPSDNEHRQPSASGNGGGGAGAVAPLCVPGEGKRPKPKSMTKFVRKEARPQPPPAPVVADTPPGGVVEALVKPMPVSVMSILGKRVQGAKGEDLGRVVDVLADASGRVRIAIIDFGGFLGVGDRRIAVDWPLLRFNPDRHDPSLLLSLSLDKLKIAPEYKNDPRPQILTGPPAPAAAPSPAVSLSAPGTVSVPVDTNK